MVDNVKLGQVASVNYGYTESASSEAIGPKFLRITDIQEGNVDWTAVPYCEINQRDFDKHKLEASDIVFARTGATTGKSFLVREPPASVPASYLIRLRITDEKLMPEYVALFFQTSTYWESIKQGSSGSAQGGFNASKLKEIEIPLHPLEEQKRIVAVLDQAFAALDRARANAEANLADADELTTQLLESELGAAELGELEPVGPHIDLLTGFAFKSRGYTDKESDIRLIRGDNIVQGDFRWDGVKRWPASDRATYAKYELQKDDVLVAMDRTWVSAGIKFAIVDEEALPSLLVQRVARLRPKAGLLPRFLGFWIGSPLFERYVLDIQTGLGVPHVSGGQLNAFEIRLPSTDTQKKIVERLNQKLSAVEKLKQSYRKQIADLESLRRSLLAEAFSGRLV